MQTQLKCELLNRILTEMMLPKYGDRIQSFECRVVHENKYYFKIIARLYNIGGFTDDEYDDFRMYCDMLDIDFFDYELAYYVVEI